MDANIRTETSGDDGDDENHDDDDDDDWHSAGEQSFSAAEKLH